MTAYWSDNIAVTEGSVVRVSTEVLSTESFTLSIVSIALGLTFSFSSDSGISISPDSGEKILSMTFLNMLPEVGKHKFLFEVHVPVATVVDFAIEVTSGDASLINASARV